MTIKPATLPTSPSNLRLLVVHDSQGQESIAQQLAVTFPSSTITTARSALTAIYLLGCQQVDAIVIGLGLGSGEPRWSAALAGLREAGGDTARIILCCPTASEQRARQLVAVGADDYIVSPLRTDEVNQALRQESFSYSHAHKSSGKSRQHEFELLEQLVHLLPLLHRDPTALLQALATNLLDLFQATGVSLVVEGTAASAGETAGEPVLTAPLLQSIRTIGQASLYAGAAGPYMPQDVIGLQVWARLCVELLNTSTELRRLGILSNTDECSGLPNRRFFRSRLNAAINHAERDRLPITVLLFDVDDFKSYNDRFGHDVGDAIIRQTGRLFQENCRDNDIVARYGGDEFAVMFWEPRGPRTPGSSPPAHALAILERFREKLRSNNFSALGAHGAGTLTISGGLATFPWDGATADDLLKRADGALIAAKRAGKNRIYLVGDQ